MFRMKYKILEEDHPEWCSEKYMITTWNKQVNPWIISSTLSRNTIPPNTVEWKSLLPMPHLCACATTKHHLTAVNEASSLGIWFAFIMSEGSNLHASQLIFPLTSGYKIKLFSRGFSVLGMFIFCRCQLCKTLRFFFHPYMIFPII